MLLLEGCVYIDSCNSVSLFQGTRKCRVTVLDRPWYQLHEVTNVMCTSTKRKYDPPAGTCCTAVAMNLPAEGTYDAVNPENTSNSVCIAFVVVLYWYSQVLALK